MSDPSERTVNDVFNSFTDKQKEALYYLIGVALELQGLASLTEEQQQVAMIIVGEGLRERQTRFWKWPL